LHRLLKATLLMPRNLTQLDEWPRHQTLDTFDMVASDSERWSDGSWICVGDPAGACHLITALRWYPNTNVVDGYAIVALDDGRQHNLRVSRRMRPAIDDLSCGPMWMRIVEGLRVLEVGATPNESGIEFDLRWDGFSPCFDETSGIRRYQDGRVVRARSNFVQVGNVSGSITVQGRRFDVDSSWVGARDHSWGIGDTGNGNQRGFAAPAGGPASAHQGATLRHFGLRHLRSSASRPGRCSSASTMQPTGGSPTTTAGWTTPTAPVARAGGTSPRRSSPSSSSRAGGGSPAPWCASAGPTAGSTASPSGRSAGPCT